MSSRQRRARASPRRAEPPSTAPFPARSLPIILALLVLTTSAYRAVGHLGFVHFDDPLYVTTNPYVQAGLSWTNVVWAFTTGHAPYWHPVTWLSHMLDVDLFGLSPTGPHLENVGLHVVNTLLVFAWLRRTTRAVWPSAFVAAVFGLHPVHVESVAWITERKDVLSACFWLLTLWAYVLYVVDRTWTRYLAVATALGLGLMAKPSVVTLPLVLLLVDIWPLGRAPLERLAPWWPLVREKLPLMALTVGTSVVTVVIQARTGAVAPLTTVSLGDRLLNGLMSYVLYVVKFLWPVHLAVFYPLHAWPVWEAPAAGALLLVATVLALSQVRDRPYLFVGWAWYLLTLVPMIGLVQVGAQAMADRFLYVPMLGLLVALAWGAADLLQTASVGVRTRLVPAVAAVTLLGLWLTTSALVPSWTDDLSLWSHAVANTKDNYLAYENLGSALYQRNDLAGALVAYQASVTALHGRWPADEAATRTNIGLVFLRQDQPAKALQDLSVAARLAPELPQAHEGIGEALASLGRLAPALDEYGAALRLNPKLVPALVGTGRALLSESRPRDAIPYLTQAVALEPKAPESHYVLGSALALDGRLEDALTQFGTAVTLDPGLVGAYSNMGFIFAQQGRLDEARREADQALAIDPTYLPAKRLAASLPHPVR